MKMHKRSYQEEFDMNTSFLSTQQIKNLINEHKFTSAQEIMNCMKNMFADVLEQTLQAEMDHHLGYEHAERRMMMLIRIIAMVPLKGHENTAGGNGGQCPQRFQRRIRTKDHLNVSAQCRWHRRTHPVPLCCRYVYP